MEVSGSAGVGGAGWCIQMGYRAGTPLQGAGVKETGEVKLGLTRGWFGVTESVRARVYPTLSSQGKQIASDYLGPYIADVPPSPQWLKQ